MKKEVNMRELELAFTELAKQYDSLFTSELIILPANHLRKIGKSTLVRQFEGFRLPQEFQKLVQDEKTAPDNKMTRSRLGRGPGDIAS